MRTSAERSKVYGGDASLREQGGIHPVGNARILRLMASHMLHSGARVTRDAGITVNGERRTSELDYDVALNVRGFEDRLDLFGNLFRRFTRQRAPFDLQFAFCRIC